MSILTPQRQKRHSRRQSSFAPPHRKVTLILSISDALARRIEGLDVPSIVISLDYRILATNSAYRQRYGVTPRLGEDRCHWVSHRYTTPCDQNGELCPIRSCRQTNAPARVTHVHHTPRGPERCDILLEPIRDEAGEVIQYLEIITPLPSDELIPGDDPLVGRTERFRRALDRVDRVAPTEMPVLVLGETGTGKELLARAVHQRSIRRDGPFVPLACSGLNPGLFEAELFGHERGAFTGARAERSGLVEEARGGTLFLDEIGDVPMPLQVKLLRLLESRTYRRVGSVQLRSADFRLVCATHRDLHQMIRSGAFRQDLYFRISAFTVRLPALRDRRADIPLLAQRFLRESAPDKRLTPTALARLSRGDFPGNVRQLRHVVQRAALLSEGPHVLPRHLLDDDDGPVLRFDAEVHVPSGPPPPEELVSLEEAEARYLRWAAAQVPKREDLAEALGVSLRTLYRKLQALSPQEP